MKKHLSSFCSLNRLIMITTLAIAPWGVTTEAAPFYGDVTGSFNWSAVTWDPDTGTAPGTTDGSVSTDQVTIDKTTSGAGELRFIENRNVESLTRLRGTGSSAGAIRLVNNVNSNLKLTIHDLFAVESGYMYLRAHHNYTSARFTIETERMEIGSTEWEGDIPTSGSIGTVYFSGHSGTNDYSRVTLKVNKTFTIIGNGRFIYDGSATGDAEIDLGDVVFRDNVHAGIPMEPTFALGTAISSGVDHRVKFRSLQSEEANSSKVTITGGATIELYGDTPAEPAEYRFYGEIKDTNRLEKTGSNTQFLSRNEGNSYSGGTLISAGTLVVENTSGSALGSGAVTVEGTGTLAGGGRIALALDTVITVKNGGTLAPGKESEDFNTLRIVAPSGSSNPALSMEVGSRFHFTIGAGNVSDSIEFLGYTEGALDLAEGGVEITLDGEISEGTYQLFVFREGGEGSALIASGLTEGLFVNHTSSAFNINLHYDDAAFGGPGVIAMEVTAIPEPASVALLAVGLTVLALRRVH